MTDKFKCRKTVYPQERYGSFKGHPCSKPVWKDGWCKVHHPESIHIRNVNRTAAWEAKRQNSPTMQAIRLKQQLTEMREAAKSACALARIKYGNLDADVDKELTRIEELIRHEGE